MLEPLSHAKLQEAVNTRARPLVRAASPVWWCASGDVAGAGAEFEGGAGGFSGVGEEGEKKRGGDDVGVETGLSPLVQVTKAWAQT